MSIRINGHPRCTNVPLPGWQAQCMHIPDMASMPRWWWIFAAASKTLFSSGQSKGKLVFFLDFLSVLSSSTALGAYSEAAYSPVACSFFRTRPVIRWTTALVLPIQTFSLGSHVHGPSFLLYISLF
jgi:hypothetical protein